MKNCCRRLAAALAGTLLALGALACGSSGTPQSAGGGSSSATTAGAYLKEDADNDGDDPHVSHRGQDDQEFLASYGPKASPAATRAIASILRSYYSASAAGEGASACALLNTALAAAIAKEQSPAAAGADACAAAIAPLLAQQHRHLLAEDPATMTVIAVYARGGLALAALGFRNSPESDILLTRAGNIWKIDALYDSLMR